MSVRRALAPAKINLGLFIGPTRPHDGRHELVTVMQSITLADELTLEPVPAGAASDELVCPDVPGPPEENLAAVAMRSFRAATGWGGPPQRLTVHKRIPLAAGLAGGSADAAAALRMTRAASGLGDDRTLLALAAELGGDVSAQIAPGRWLASGAGERLQALPAPREPFGVLVLPAAGGLSTAAVYAEADRLGLRRAPGALQDRLAELRAAFAHGSPLPPGELLCNDLQPAALSLCPEIAQRLEGARAVGADVALVSGSGPTVLGLFAAEAGGKGGLARAAEAAERGGWDPPALWAEPVDGSFGEVATIR